MTTRSLLTPGNLVWITAYVYMGTWCRTLRGVTIANHDDKLTLILLGTETLELEVLLIQDIAEVEKL